MLKSISNYFLSRSTREKLILLFFLLACLLTLSQSSLSKFSQQLQSYKSTNATLQSQNLWLKNKSSIFSRIQSAQSSLSPSNSYSKDSFVEKIDKIAKSIDIPYELLNDPTPSSSPSPIKELSLSINFQSLPIDKLQAFSDAILKEHPYIAFSSIELSSLPRNPSILQAKISLTALQIQPTK